MISQYYDGTVNMYKLIMSTEHFFFAGICQGNSMDHYMLFILLLFHGSVNWNVIKLHGSVLKHGLFLITFSSINHLERYGAAYSSDLYTSCCFIIISAVTNRLHHFFYAVQVCYIEARGLYTEDAVNLCMLCSCFLKQLFYFSVTFLPFFCLSYCLLVSWNMRHVD